MTERPDNADIERELYQLGLSDSPPRARRTLPTQTSFPLSTGRGDTFLYSPEFKSTEASRISLQRLRSLPPDPLLVHNAATSDAYSSPSDSWRGASIRSSSAPAMPFERSLSYSEEALLLSGVDRLRQASHGTRSLNDVEPTRRRSSSQGSATSKSNPRSYRRPQINMAPPTSILQDPGGVHYPGYVELQDFLTLPKGTAESAEDEELMLEEAEAEIVERELIASIEAMLRRVHAGIQESYIHYEHPDSVADPPPPQPVGATLSDPPPSPEPPHNNLSPPQPSYNGLRSNNLQRMQHTRGLPMGPTSVTTSSHPPPPHFRTRAPPVRGIIAAPRLIDPNNASVLSRQVGFIPIQDPALKKQETPKSRHHRHHHYHHHRHDHHQNFETRTSVDHQHHHHHHQRKKSSKALKRIRVSTKSFF